jgi:nucleotide-binding universal stress UspA family protein
MSYATIMVHVDVERDSEQRVQLALGLADRFDATLIGVAGLAPEPAFAGGGVVVYGEPSKQHLCKMKGRLEEAGRKFCIQGQGLREVEWRTALELPSELLIREARAADLIIAGPRRGGRADPVDPGVILLRAGRPVLVVPDVIAPLALRRVIVAWKDTRECRRAVRDARPFLQQAREVLLFTAGEDEAQSRAEKHLGDVASYLERHRVIVAEKVWRRARGPAATEILHFARDENADLVVAGGYGHSRLGEWIFGGVTHDLLAAGSTCCMLAH